MVGAGHPRRPGRPVSGLVVDQPLQARPTASGAGRLRSEHRQVPSVDRGVGEQLHRIHHIGQVAEGRSRAGPVPLGYSRRTRRKRFMTGPWGTLDRGPGRVERAGEEAAYAALGERGKTRVTGSSRMSDHVRSRSRARSRVAIGLAAVGVAFLTVTTVLGQAEARVSRRTAALVDAGSTQLYACAGTAVQVIRSSELAVTLACLDGVQAIGRTRTDSRTNSATARTALPAGTTEGTLLVSTLQTPAATTVSMPGWTKAYDAVSGPNGLRLSAWYRVAARDDSAATARISPASRTSMITAAFDGADARTPIGFAGAGTGLTAPTPPPGVDGAQWLSGLGVLGRRAQVDQPTGVPNVRTLVNGDMRTAQALLASQPAVVPSMTWSARRIRSAVTGLLSVVPGSAASVPSGAVPLAAGEKKQVTCAAPRLEYVLVSPTVAEVTCPSADATNSPTATATSATTPPTATSTNPSTTTTTPPPPTTTSTNPSTTTTAPPTTTTAPPTTTTAPPTTTTAPPTTTTAPPSTTPPATTGAPVGQKCTSPVWRSSTPDAMWFDGGYVVHNNMWNAGAYQVSQTTEACSYKSWNVIATADNSRGDGAVKTYPNVHRDYHNWNSGAEPAWSSIARLQSSFAAVGPRVGIYNIAYDIWMNGVPGNREIMIWTENYNQVPAGSRVSSGVVLSGITWDVYATSGNGYLAFVPRSPLATGTLDLKAMIDWLVSQGRVQSNATLGQVCFGVEIVSTGGNPATFQFTDFSVTS